MKQEITIVITESDPANEGAGIYINNIFIPVKELEFTFTEDGSDVVKLNIHRFRITIKTC